MTNFKRTLVRLALWLPLALLLASLGEPLAVARPITADPHNLMQIQLARPMSGGFGLALNWNTFLGGSIEPGSDVGQGITVDDNGNVYVVGSSYAPWGSPVRAYTTGTDAFVAKLGNDGSLIWHTFLGGGGDDFGYGIAVDGSGNVFVAGHSLATWGSPVRAYTAADDAFVARLDSDGNLIWNTFLGGIGWDDIYGQGIAVDGDENVYVAGYSSASWGNPVRAHAEGDDAFAAKLGGNGNLIWNTFLGGGGSDRGMAIAVDGNGNVYTVGGSYVAWGSPIRAYTAADDAFAAKLDNNGNLTWNTFLGGSANDYGYGIVVDGSGNVYVAGDSGEYWNNSRGSFAAKLGSDGSLTWNTSIGGSGTYGYDIAVDGSENVYVAGDSYASWGNPVRAYTAGADAFAAKLDSDGSLTWNTFLGGNGYDYGHSIAVDGSGNIYVVGDSFATWGSPMRTYSAAADAFVAKLGPYGVSPIFLPIVVRAAP